MERIILIKDIVFKDCLFFVIFMLIRYNFVIYLVGFFIFNLIIIYEIKNFIGEYGFIKMVKFVRWLYW